MPTAEREITTDRSRERYLCGLTAKDIFSVLSTLILPLMLGIFTVILTFEQKAEGVRQRLEDRRLASEQREQDLNISGEQRREDRELAREQREQDLNISILQRDLDKLIAQNQRADDQLRRKLDLEIAGNKSAQDDQLAEKARNLSREQRAHELAIEDVRHRDSLLERYMDEMGQALEQNNGTLTSNPLTATLVRLKTLTLIRRLDPSRNSQVIRFLHEAGQLTTDKNPLDLSDAELNGVDLSSPRLDNPMAALHLTRAYLADSSFANRDLTRSNFSGSVMHRVNFSGSTLQEIDFYRTKFSGPSAWHGVTIEKLHFEEAEFEHFDFSDALQLTTSLTAVDFTAVQFSSTSFARLLLREVTFRHGSNITWINLDFTGTHFVASVFDHMELPRWNFTKTLFDQCNFLDCTFIESVFFNTTFIHSNFFRWNVASSQISYSSVTADSEFRSIELWNNSFHHLLVSKNYFNLGSIGDCQFSHVTIQYSQFYQIRMVKTRFFDADLGEAVEFFECLLENIAFSPGAQLQTIGFQETTVKHSDMSRSNLTRARFALVRFEFVNFSHADLRGANLDMAEMISCNLTGALVSDAQVVSALSLDNTILPNGTLHRDASLLRNGRAECRVLLHASWLIEQGAISVKQKTPTDCSFVRANHSTTNAIISQRVNIARYGRAIEQNRAAFTMHADCSHVMINLIERHRPSNTRLNEWKNITTDGETWLLQDRNTNELEIRLQFDGSGPAECDNLQLFLGLYFQELEEAFADRKKK